MTVVSSVLLSITPSPLCVQAVEIAPGQMQLARTPCLAPSPATPFMKAWMNPLVPP